MQSAEHVDGCVGLLYRHLCTNMWQLCVNQVVPHSSQTGIYCISSNEALLAIT